VSVIFGFLFPGRQRPLCRGAFDICISDHFHLFRCYATVAQKELIFDIFVTSIILHFISVLFHSIVLKLHASTIGLCLQYHL